jgi:hypothetical protein
VHTLKIRFAGFQGKHETCPSVEKCPGNSIESKPDKKWHPGEEEISLSISSTTRAPQKGASNDG